MSMSDESFNKIMRMIAKNGMENEASALCNHEIAQRDAVARVEAELSDIRHKAFTAVMARDAAQAQLAEAMALLRYAMESSSFREIITLERDIAAFLARHAQAEQQEARGAQAGEFQREDRYIVIKRKDLDAAPLADRERFNSALLMLTLNLPMREYLVIESDWPEYEPTWAAIQARVEGRAALATQPAVPVYLPEANVWDAPSMSADTEPEIAWRDGFNDARDRVMNAVRGAEHE